MDTSRYLPFSLVNRTEKNRFKLKKPNKKMGSNGTVVEPEFDGTCLVGIRA